MEACLEDINDWFRPLWPIYIKCRDSIVDNKKKTKKCNGNQAVFESAFCQYSQLLSSTCLSQTDCRRKNIEVRNQIHANVSIAEAARHTDCEVGHKVKCLLQIFEEKNNTKKPGMLAACKALKPECPAGITYPDIPGPHQCQSEAHNPCDGAWVEGEYSTKVWFAKAPTAKCTSCLKPEIPYPAPPSGQPEWPRVVGQGSWFGMPKEKVVDGKCSEEHVSSAYNMLYGCTNPGEGGGWRSQRCPKPINRKCSDLMWFTMDLGSIQFVNSITIKPAAGERHWYRSSHYELLISSDEPGPRGPYNYATAPPFSETSTGFTQVVENNLHHGNTANTRSAFTHSIDKMARYVMFHAINWNHGKNQAFGSGVEYLRINLR